MYGYSYSSVPKILDQTFAQVIKRPRQYGPFTRTLLLLLVEQTRQRLLLGQGRDGKRALAAAAHGALLLAEHAAGGIPNAMATHAVTPVVSHVNPVHTLAVHRCGTRTALEAATASTPLKGRGNRGPRATGGEDRAGGGVVLDSGAKAAGAKVIGTAFAEGRSRRRIPAEVYSASARAWEIGLRPAVAKGRA